MHHGVIGLRREGQGVTGLGWVVQAPQEQPKPDLEQQATPMPGTEEEAAGKPQLACIAALTLVFMGYNPASNHPNL